MEQIGKKELRNAVRQLARDMEPDVREELSECIMERLEALPAFENARTVALYHALPDEVATAKFIAKWAGRKKIALPVVSGDRMVFREYVPGEAVCEGAFGISEPVAGETVDPAQIDFAVIPGMAFSRSCQRLGRGKGFYDRFLPNTKAYRAGVCFGARLVEGIRCEPHDVQMDAVITERETICSEKAHS